MRYTYHRQPARWARYGTAFLVTVLALSLTLVLPTLRDHAMFMLVVSAVAMSAWYGGLGPAILSIVVGGWGGTLILLPSLYSLDFPNWESLSGLVSFLIVAFFISTLNATSRRAQEKISGVLESITDGFIILDSKWNYVHLNDQAATLARRTRQQLIGKNVWEEFPELVNSTFYTECHRAITENTPVDFEYFYAPFEQWFEFRAYPSAEGLTLYLSDITVRKRASLMILKYNEELEQRVKDRTGELEGANAALIRQVAEHTQTEAALRHSEERFRSLAESANDAIVSADSNGLILSWNRSAETIFGYPEKEVIGMPLTMLMPHRYRDAHQQGMQRMREGSESPLVGKTIELHGLKKDGTEFALELSLAAWKTAGSSFFSGIIRDISARKQAEESLAERVQELARSNAELQRFAYVASHDMQEPLRMVASYTQLLASRYTEKLGPEADYFITYIVDGARRMERLIQDILAYSLFDASKKASMSVDCEEVLTSALKNLETTIQASGATITHDTLPTIDAVPAQLSQVFQNLIGNAIKFSREPPKIHISAERPPQTSENTNGWVFSVRDNGIGIHPDYSEQIFEVFRRLNLRHEYPGTGIGLAICKKVIERHSGRIWVKSQYGQGSTFFFSIPSKGNGHDHT
ncbi:MAG TPA: PAS domain S-box protein [Nitrospirales bacterium]|jgi:PAS domain S-box-containing protein